MKKFFAVLFALLIGCSCAVSAFAADTTSYTVTYKTNCDDTTVTAPDAVSITSGTTIVIADGPAYSGYKFNGWNTATDGKGVSYSAKDSVTVSADITLYAQWVKTYTVTYKTNVTDTSVKAPDTATVESGNAITLAAAPTYNTGYTFTGWNTKADGTGTNYAEKASVTLTDNLTLYAQWKKADVTTSYTLTVVTKGGAKDEKAETKLNAGDTISFNNSVPDGYYLEGVYTDADCKNAYTENKMAAKDLTLYVKLAIKVSKIESILKAVDTAAVIKASGLSQSAFDAKAESLGYTVKYSVGEKEYTVKEFSNYADEIVTTLKNDVAYGKTGTLTITAQQGKNAQPETITYFVYNDVAPADATASDTTATSATTGTTDIATETQVTATTGSDDSDATVQTEVPSTGFTMTKVICAVVALVAACTAAGVTVVMSKKKKETEA